VRSNGWSAGRVKPGSGWVRRQQSSVTLVVGASSFLRMPLLLPVGAGEICPVTSKWGLNDDLSQFVTELAARAMCRPVNLVLV
jgi:hypothetical protein